MRRHQTLLIALLLIAFSLAAEAAQTGKIIIANANAADPAARQIVRTVANESLKTISTKDSTSDSIAQDAPIVDRLEDGEISLPPKIAIEPEPGVRTPAAESLHAAPVADDTAEPSHPPAHPDSKSANAKVPTSKEHVEGVPPEKALRWLQNGNKRYLKKSNRADGKSQVDRDRLKKSQHPHAIILSCSDSRVPPETVFDQALGEVFVVRTAGENLDASVIASIEYAVEHLGPRLLVVMGHTSCGAVAAALATPEGSSAGSPSLDSLIADIKPRLPHGPAGKTSEALEVESSANAQGVAADLLKRSSIVRARVEKGDLVIKPALYYLDSGTVKFY